jgi:hypothetical protein
METKKMYLDKGHINRPDTKITVTGVIVHWTANESKGANALANRNYFNRKWRMLKNPKTKEMDEYELQDEHGSPVLYRHASAHLNVDDKTLIECLPWKKGEAEQGYHVGATSYKAAALKSLKTKHPNECTIGLEICVNSDGDFIKAYANGIVVIAMMLKEHGLGIEALYRHYDITGKLCPGFHTQDLYAQKYLKTTANLAWSRFKELVAAQLKPTMITPPKPILALFKAGLVKERVESTDVQLLSIPKGKFKLQLVWEKGAKVSTLVKKYGATYGINFPYFWDGSPVSDLKIGDKIIAHPTTGKTTKWTGLKYKDGVAAIGKFPITEVLGANGFLVKSSPVLVEGSKNVQAAYVKNDETAADIATTKCQRTAIGIDKNGNLLVVVTDGREGAGNVGLGLNDLANYLVSKGAVTALNGDGGSSSVLANKNGVVIGNIGAEERAVNHALLIFIDEPVTSIPPVVKQYWRIFMDGVQQAAYSTAENGLIATKELYTKTRNSTIVLMNPNGSAYYTPSKHLDDFK